MTIYTTVSDCDNLYIRDDAFFNDLYQQKSNYINNNSNLHLFLFASKTILLYLCARKMKTQTFYLQSPLHE